MATGSQRVSPQSSPLSMRRLDKHADGCLSVSSRLAGGSRVDAAREIPESSVLNFSQRKLSVWLSVNDGLALWAVIRRHLASDSAEPRSPLHSNLSRGRWWDGTASAATKSGNILSPSVVYVPIPPSLSSSSSIKTDHAGYTSPRLHFQLVTPIWRGLQITWCHTDSQYFLTLKRIISWLI